MEAFNCLAFLKVIALLFLIHLQIFCGKLTITSYFSDGYTTEELDFVWHPYKTPLKMRSNLVLPEFEITGSSARNCDANFTTGMKNSVPQLVIISANGTRHPDILS